MKYFLFAVFSMAVLLQNTAVSHAEGCSLSGVELNCPGKKDADILNSFAAPETLNLLDDPAASAGKFEKPVDLEVFRRSVEKVWRSVNRAEKVERRRMLNRRISAEEFEKWSNTYRSAETNYDAALNFYRNLVWLGKTGKAPPQG